MTDRQTEASYTPAHIHGDTTVYTNNTDRKGERNDRCERGTHKSDTNAHAHTARGPTSSSHLPATAADRPKHTIAVEKMGTTPPSDQSVEQEAITPTSRVRGMLKMDQA